MTRPIDRSPTTVLYAHSSSLVGGGNVVLLRLLAALDRSRFRPISLIPESGPLEERLRAIDVPYHVLDVRSAQRRLVDEALTLARLFMLKRRQRVDLVHSNDPNTYRMVSKLYCRRQRLCHIHHPDIRRDSLAWSFQRPPATTVVPTNMVAEVVRQGLEQLPASLSSPVHVVGNPIDTEWFAPAPDVPAIRRRLGLCPDRPHVALVGSLSHHKGHECFLRMARRICDERPDVTFSIVGGVTTANREYVDRLTALTQTLGIADRVKFWGFVDDATARDIIAASSVFVLPTKEEGFGLVLAEAQACGIPVLTSTIPPLAEVVLDGETGYLLNSNDDAAFAARALEMIDDPDRCAAMGQAGRAHVLERFAIPSFVRKITSIYSDLVDEGESL